MSLTPTQLKRLHILKKEMGLDDEMRRGIIDQRYSVRSFKDLTYEQAGELIIEWGKETQGAWQKKKYFQGGCSDNQVNYIYALAMQLGASDMLEVLQKTERYLKQMKIIKRIASLSNLTVKEAKDVIDAMKSKLDREPKTNILKGPGSE